MVLLVCTTTVLDFLTVRHFCGCFADGVGVSQDYMRTVTEIESEWLIEIAPHLYKPKDVEAVDTKKMPKALGKSSASAVE